MAIAVLAQPFDKMSGKIGGLGSPVPYSSGQRTITRRLVQPANPQSALQVQIRDAMTQASQAYSQISDSDKNNWINLNSQLSRNDVFGTTYKMTAKGLYTGVNIMRLIDGQATSDTAPAATLAAAVDNLTRLEENIANDAIGITYDFSNTDGFFFVEFTAPLPGTARQPRDTDFRSVTTDMSTAFAPWSASPKVGAFDFTDMNFQIRAGDRIGVRITSYNAGYLKGQSKVFVQTVTQEV